jgi:hypothetical protein
MPPTPPAPSPDPGFGTGVAFAIPGLSLQVTVEPVALLILIALTGVVVAVVLRTARDRTVEVIVDIPLGGLGRITFNADREVARLAHQAWIEITTRKAGLPYDSEHDVIEEVFDSWYELFKQLRVISKDVPTPSLRTKHARALVKVLVEAMNSGLRPALTKWQARYRAWLAAERLQLKGEWEDPQTTQARYPFYEDMIVDIRRVNQELRGLAVALDRIAQRATKEADEAGG